MIDGDRFAGDRPLAFAPRVGLGHNHYGFLLFVGDQVFTRRFIHFPRPRFSRDARSDGLDSSAAFGAVGVMHADAGTV